MKHLRYFEGFNIKEMVPFAINIADCSAEERMEILNMLEKYADFRFNGPSTKERFVADRDSTGLAWCWRVSREKGWFSDPDRFYMSGVHTKGWVDDSIGGSMEHMITGKEFIRLGLEESLIVMVEDVENKRAEKEANKYNI